jgi:hypothetical protein
MSEELEQEQVEVTEPVETVAEEVVETPDVEVVEPVAETKPEFKPDFTYKFNGEVKEMDQMFHGLIKDEESNKRIRDLIERSEATEYHKTRTKEFESKIGEWQPKVELLEQFQSAYDSAKTPEDHLALLNEIGYNPESLKDVVREILRREQMTPEEQQQFAARQRDALEKNQLMSQNQVLAQEYNSALMSLTQQQMDFELGKAENSELARAYEEVNGEGSFQEFFLERGMYYTQITGKHVPPGEVMARVAKEFAPFLSRKQEAGASAQPQVLKPKHKTMPSVGTQSASPTQSSIRSLDDLKAKYNQLTGQD